MALHETFSFLWSESALAWSQSSVACLQTVWVAAHITKMFSKFIVNEEAQSSHQANNYILKAETS